MWSIPEATRQTELIKKQPKEIVKIKTSKTKCHGTCELMCN